MLIAWLLLTADARDAVRTPIARPDEAYFLLQGPVSCPVKLVVNAKGRPEGAQVAGCPAVLGDAIHDAAMRWRFARTPRATVEEVQVEVRPPSLPPRARRGTCLLGFLVSGDQPRLMADVPRRCGVRTGPVKGRVAVPPEVTWCAVDVVVQDGEVASVTAQACDPALALLARHAVAAWDLDTGRDQQWKLVLGFGPAPSRSIDFG